MAKVSGPLLSLGASGTIANTLTFSNWKGQAYVRQRITPYNPQSTNQTSQRTKFTDAVVLWQGKDTSTKGDWNTRARQLGYTMSGFNFFVQQYLAQGEDPTLP